MDVSDLEELWKKSPFFDYCAPILKDDYEFSCTKLLERIEKILINVQLEELNIENIHNELCEELKEFNEISNELTNKIESLTSLANTHFCVNNDLKHFVENISSQWQQIRKEENLNYYRVRISSRTVLKKIRIDADEIKLLLQFSICHCNQQCIEKGYCIWKEIYQLVDNIAIYDQKVQSMMPIRELTPHVNNFISSIMNFVNSNEFIQLNSTSDEHSVFSYVSQLLTGELLGYKPIEPEFVLKTNKPKRPIFITKVIKKKLTVL